MEDTSFLHFIIEALGALVMFFMKQWIDEEKVQNASLMKKVEELDKQTTDVRLNYVHKTDFSEFKKDLWDRFDKLETKLESMMKR